MDTKNSHEQRTPIIRATIILIVILLVITAPIAHTQQLATTIKQGDYTIYDEKIIIAYKKDGIIQIQQNDIYTQQRQTLNINTTVPVNILDIKIKDSIIQILTYTKILDRKIIIIYNIDLQTLKIIENKAIDITDILQKQELDTGNIINNTIIIITKNNIIQINLYNNSIINNIAINTTYNQSYIDETQDRLHIIYITGNKTLLVTIYNNSIEKRIIEGIVLDIDDNRNYMNIIINNKTIISSINKNVIKVNGIISSICTFNDIVYYSKIYGNITILNLVYLNNMTHYMLSKYPSTIIDMTCTNDYIVLVFDDYTMIVEMIQDLMRSMELLTVTTKNMYNNTYNISETNYKNNSDVNMTINYEDSENRNIYITILKISSIILLILIIVLIIYIVKSSRR